MPQDPSDQYRSSNWDCTIASYGLSQSSSAEIELAEEAPYCQIYGIGTGQRNGDRFTKIGEYFEAKDLLKDHEGVVEGDRERSERRKREANYSDSAEEVPEEEEKAFNRKMKRERKAKKERENIQDKHDEDQGPPASSDIEGDVRTKFVRERGDPEEETEVEKPGSAPTNEDEKVDKRAGYLIEHNAGPDTDDNGESRDEDRKEVEHLLEQRRERVLRRIGDSEKTTGTPSREITDNDVSGSLREIETRMTSTSEPTTTEHEKATSTQPDTDDDAFTTIQFDADKETLRELGDEKNMIEDDKDYVMPSTIAADSEGHSPLNNIPERPLKRKTPRKFLSIDVETYLLKHVKRKMIYQLSINVINGFEALSALTSRSLRNIDICQINVILPKPSKKNFEQFASFYKYALKSMGLLPMIVDLIDGDTRIYFINTTSPVCLNLFLFSSGKLGG
ncbi:hypothetical protein Y032_0050g1905 [Ancylostoma ceylanicum]|uniref:Uncharacterized protein n=1 Tax=Ancylostoma ceylanicum TaxID=53326 RepID=A0A016U926_9BILA|nr:hypothetical protein Y032_0050g1905 [Ancylostoma ceylanicum]